MAEERKQGDSVAHDACWRVKEFPAMMEEEEKEDAGLERASWRSAGVGLTVQAAN